MKSLMLKYTVIFFFILSQHAVFAQLDWVHKESLPSSGRYSHIAFVIGNNAYAGLGSIDAAQRIYTSGFFKYNPADDAWIRLNDFPGRGLYAASAFSINGKGYICLGVDTTHAWTNDVWEFNPVTESWLKKSNFPGGNRYASATFVIDGKGYLVGGSVNAGENYLNDLWCYTPETDTWVQKASLPTDHKSCATAFTINGKGYVVCGGYSTMQPTKDFYEYNPVNDSWIRLPDFPGIRTGAIGFVLGDKAFVGTGTDLNTTYKTFWYYTPSSNAWTTVPDPPAAFSQRMLGTAFSIGNTGYVLGGRSEPYDPFYTNGKMLSDLWAFTDCTLPVADFTYRHDRFVVSFSDSSSGASVYHWSFGDGTHSSEKDPVHTFRPGVYNVCLLAANECGQDSVCKSVQIDCMEPVARFVYAVSYPEAQYIDSSSTFSLISRLWDFGDSTYSTEPNPQHIYNTPGVYVVCLTVTDSCGTNTVCEPMYLLIPMKLDIAITPEATNDLVAHFSDLTSGTTYWKWKFGDGDTSILRNPSHTYKKYGNYQVCLTAGNSQSIGTFCDTLLLSVNPLLHQAQPLLVYPNPSDGKLFIKFYRNCASTGIHVLDQSGRSVFDQHLSSPDLMTPTAIDLTSLSKAVYYFQVECDDYKKTWKIDIR
jgi:PKD repeat protein/N-acetylneuraminic acid mutarotase